MLRNAVAKASRLLASEMWAVPFRDMVMMSEEEKKLFQSLYDALGAFNKHALQGKKDGGS